MDDKSKAELYASNARKIGEADWGVNPKAELKEDSTLLNGKKLKGLCILQ